jgi:hypothetical protein
MDHLAKRDRLFLFPLKVRCLFGDQPYVHGKDWQEWATYPERMGWTWQGQSYSRDTLELDIRWSLLCILYLSIIICSENQYTNKAADVCASSNSTERSVILNLE